MFNNQIVLNEIKQGSAVLFELFLANLWSNQSPFWLQRYPLYNLFGVFLTDPIAGIKAPKRPEERIFIPPSMQLVPSDRKPLFKNNNHCLLIVITKSYQLLKVILITMKNTDHLWTTFIHREITPRILASYRCHRGISNDKLLRPKI